jgi:hypothetical protein
MVFIISEQATRSLLPSSVSKSIPDIVLAALDFSKVKFIFLLCRLDTHSRVFRSVFVKWYA